MKKIFTLIILSVFCVFGTIYGVDSVSTNTNKVVAMDTDSQMVLYGKNVNKKVYPASTTKIITAILAIEKLDLTENVVASKTAVDIPWDSSAIYVKEGEIFTVEELLYGLLLNSGNDAANVLAEKVAGNIKDFIKMMNDKAKEIGCTNTHFNNAHGYSDDNHYTTAEDMAKILSYCIKNETFVKIISTKKYIINETNKTSSKRYLQNTNRLIQTKQDNVYGRYYEYCIGGKTGFTNEAGRCLVAYGKKDNKNVVVTIFGASTKGADDARYTDAINLFEYAFNNFKNEKIVSKENYNYEYININENLKYKVYLAEDLNMLVSDNLKPDNIAYTINIHKEKISSESKLDDEVGNIQFKIAMSDGSEYVANKPLKLKEIEKYQTITSKDYKLIIVIVLMIILLILIMFMLKQNKRKRVNKSQKIVSRKHRRNIK